MSYWYLAIAIIAEVVATSALKASEEFTRLIPSIIALVGYLISLYFMVLVFRVIPVGITYAIWSGAGIVAITIISIFLYNQTPDLPAIIGISLIVLGVVIIHLFSKTIEH